MRRAESPRSQSGENWNLVRALQFTLPILGLLPLMYCCCFPLKRKGGEEGWEGGTEAGVAEKLCSEGRFRHAGRFLVLSVAR